MRRREFLSVLSGAAAGWPLVALAQQTQQVRRIGVLMGIPEGDPQAQPEMAAFESSLRHLGRTPGRNVQIDYRWGGNTARGEILAEELTSLRPDVLLGRTTPAVAALKKATHHIPIVFVIVVEPIASGFVESLARPGGNITGFTNFEASHAGKWLDLLKQVSPPITHVALLYNPITAPYTKVLLEVVASATRTVRTTATPIQDIAGLEQAISALAREPNGGLVAMPDSFIIDQRRMIIDLAARHRLPAIYPNSICTIDGGLMSYGVDYPDLFRRAAEYINRIFNGEKPAALPVQQPTKFKLVLNLKTAKALSLEFPSKLLFTADEVIE